MRAYVLEKSAKRPTLAERPDPTPGAGEVLVRTLAVALHPVDLETANGGNAMLLPHGRPFVPGVDFAGVVEGAGAPDLPAGTPVYGYRGIAAQGAFAEFLAVALGELAKAPPGHSAEALACLPLPALCALQALDEAGLDAPGRILVHGGAGGVGGIAVQVFARLGHHVTATAGAADVDRVRTYGAAEVIDYRQTRFDDVTQGLDLVFDTVGGDTLNRSFKVVRPGGTVVSLRAMPQADVLRAAGLSVPWLMSWLLPVMRVGPRRRARAAGVGLVGQVTVPDGARLAALADLAQHEVMQTRIDRGFSFDELPAAMDHYASGDARGRVVVTMA